MQTVPVHQAKDRFSSLLQAVEDGEEIVITRHGKKIARIVKETESAPSASEREKRRKQAIAELEAYQARAQVQPAVEGHTDWKSLRGHRAQMKTHCARCIRRGCLGDP